MLLTRLPYGKDIGMGSSTLDPVQAARRGYVVIVQDTRGRFASEGEWNPFENESEDGFNTIAWAAALPYADGQVGMFGPSYLGFTQWAAAVQQPPALKAMAPRVTWSDSLNGFGFRGGALELGTQAMWGLQMGFDQFVRQHRENPPALGAAFWSLAREVDLLGTEGYASLPLNDFALERESGSHPRRGAPDGAGIPDGSTRPARGGGPPGRACLFDACPGARPGSHRAGDGGAVGMLLGA